MWSYRENSPRSPACSCPLTWLPCLETFSLQLQNNANHYPSFSQLFDHNTQQEKHFLWQLSTHIQEHPETVLFWIHSFCFSRSTLHPSPADAYGSYLQALLPFSQRWVWPMGSTSRRCRWQEESGGGHFLILAPTCQLAVGCLLASSEDHRSC